MMIRVALLSFWHVNARDYVQQARANPATTITAVWDETPERGRAQAHALEVSFYEDLPELLAQAGVDGVIVTTPTTMHREVMVAAARAGKHIFTEKVLAPTLRECNAIVAAVEQAGDDLQLVRKWRADAAAWHDLFLTRLGTVLLSCLHVQPC